MQFSPAPSAYIFFRIDAAFSQERLAATRAKQPVTIGLSPPFRKGLAISGSADLPKQLFKVRVPVSVAFALEMKMIMAQFVLDDHLGLLGSVQFIVFSADVDMMRAERIPSSACPQSVVESGPMEKRPAEIFE